MAQKRIMIFIEGEGGGGKPAARKYNDGEFRKSWKLFLQPLADLAQQKGIAFFQCIPGRGGMSTADTFANPMPKDKGALRILIVDSEAPINELGKPWNELKKPPPVWADDGSCYLMVQCLETWLLADVGSLVAYYSKHGRCFNENKMKAWNDLEAMPRKMLQEALEQATVRCPRPYAHADGNMLIAVVERDKLKNLPSVARLFRGLEEKINEYANM